MEKSTSKTFIRNPSWWGRRSRWQWTVLAAASIFVCSVLTIKLYFRDTRRSEMVPSLLDFLSGLNHQPLLGGHSKDYEDICLTPGCVLAAAQVLKNMNPLVNPCDNFYEYSCGNFIKETVIPDDRPSVSSFSAIDDKLTEQLRIVLEDPSAEDEARPFRMAKDLYKTCMNKTQIERIGLSHMKEIIRRVGGWPVLGGDGWDASSFTWPDTIYKFKEEGFIIDYLISFSVTIDQKNSSKRVIDLDEAVLSLGREYLVKGMEEELVMALYKYMVDVAVLFGADRDRAVVELKESLEFEIKIANICLPREERRDVTKLYNPMNILQLHERFPSIPWYEYVSTILPLSVGVQLNEVVIVDVPSYIEGLERLLSTTPRRVQANYLLWRAVQSAVLFLTEPLRKLQLEYAEVLSGQTERKPRWKECVGVSAQMLPFALSSLYVNHYFNGEAKENSLEMVQNIREEMYNTLQTVDWMDGDTRKNALRKAKAMTSHIAYPEEIRDVSKLEEFYHKLELTQGNYLEAITNLTKFGMDFSFNRLREPVNKTDWRNHGRSAVVNAFYNPTENSLQLPAGILQGGFFSHDRPHFMNYGAIGFVIGHEITHGFDDRGRRFDNDGNLVDWWAPATAEAYLAKTSCIIQQYGNYSVKQVGLNVNGVNTQGENIADNGGIKEAYRAYNRWVQDHGQEKRLPGLQDLSPRQMFWLSAANIWCWKYRPEYLKLHIITGEHSPAEFRVLGPFSNLPEFANDFKCPTGSKMNPDEKCQVW